MPRFRTLISATTLAIAWLFASAPAAAADTLPVIHVYKSRTCGCCGKWVEHLRDAGFEVVTEDVANMQAIKTEAQIPPLGGSCHTAKVDGYVVEGHVPADAIMRMLRERPEIAGLTVPGMPEGSPGMETGQVEEYEILSFTADGEMQIYETRPN